MTELKPCPFCGNKALIAELKGGKFPRYSVLCPNSRCFASEASIFGKRYVNKSDAIEAWNRRAGEAKE